MEDFKSKIIEVKNAYDLADYIQDSGITLKQNGVGRMKGLCPFHSEKTPSFIVNEAFQSYRCFGCGANGDLLSFVQEYESLSFIEALRSLAEARGISVETNEEPGVNYQALKKIVKYSAKFFRRNFIDLPEDHPAKLEITKRGLSLKKMPYGYSPEGRTALYDYLSSLGFKDEDILITGVCRQYEEGGRIVDFWNGRLIFFILDITGKPIGFSSRKLRESDKGGKYINSPDSPVFNKSKALYNISKARKVAAGEERIYVTEGQFDVAAFVEAGVDNVVASSGTAFTEEQAMMCRRLVRDTGEIVFCFDGDAAGRSASRKVFEKTPIIHSQSYAVPFPADSDPSDLREDLGNELFLKFIEKKKIPLVSYILDGLLAEYDMASELGREAYVSESLDILRGITSPTLRDSFLRRVAINSFTSLELLRESLGGSPGIVKELFIEQEVEELSSDDDTEQKLLNYFENDMYSLPYRILALLVEAPFLKEVYPLSEVSKLFPKPLRNILKEIYDSDDFVLESLTYSVLMEKIISANFFPMIHIMDDFHREKQYRFVVEELRGWLKEYFSEKIQRKLSENIKNGDISVLDDALKAESIKLKELEESFD